ncbi:HpaII family restriction endonuclease [Mycoplasmopsis agassizii]|uniref:HpaII family restriction endonuclease n=1 Tax=Mycoplasmopsis agassizii TaxID=33922 RepID=UPI003528264E
MKLSFNRGEWSEIYTVLYLLFNPNLELVDSKLNSISTNLLRIKSINLKNNQDEIFIKYLVEDSGNVKILSDKKILGIISKEELEQNKSLILNNILDSKPGKRSFTIKGIKNFLQKLDNENYIKANSLKKSDLDSTVHDLKTDNLIDLSYSIKSSLGSPSTILNSSKRTNFLYKINDLKKEDIEVINSIHTRAKLVDRINKIYSLGGSIEFVKVSDSTFDYNLKMIDSNLPFYLGNALLKSYEKGVKI